jgi:tRNA dimethylallyltransferase
MELTGELFSSFGPGVGVFGPTAFPVSIAGVWLPREALAHRIEARVAAMRTAGLLHEVSALQGRLSRTARQAIGYKELLDALENGGDIDEAFAMTARRTRSFARRQRMWFRRDARITWLGAAENPCLALAPLLALWGA